MPETPAVPAAPEATTLLDAKAVLSAARDPARFALLRILADGAPRSVGELAARLDRAEDNISKHLRVLRNARMIRPARPEGSDGRMQYYEVPALFRTRDGAGKAALDFGVVVVRLE